MIWPIVSLLAIASAFALGYVLGVCRPCEHDVPYGGAGEQKGDHR